MKPFIVFFKLDVQCIAPNDVVQYLKDTLFPNGIGKPVIIIDRCRKDKDGLTVTLRYDLEEARVENAVIAICEIMDFGCLGKETIFSVMDSTKNEMVSVKVFQDGSVKIAA